MDNQATSEVAYKKTGTNFL